MEYIFFLTLFVWLLSHTILNRKSRRHEFNSSYIFCLFSIQGKKTQINEIFFKSIYIKKSYPNIFCKLNHDNLTFYFPLISIALYEYSSIVQSPFFVQKSTSLSNLILYTRLFIVYVYFLQEGINYCILFIFHDFLVELWRICGLKTKDFK